MADDSMKLKILPPTLREKKRYIGAKIYSREPLTKEEISNIIWHNTVNLYGEIEASKINPWIINSKEIKNSNHFQHNTIIKCQRGYEEKLITALSSIYRNRKNRIVVHTVGTSGTIKSLNNKYHLL